MKSATRRTLSKITSCTGSGETAQGFALFDAPELHRIADIPVERLHATYTFESAVQYLARLVPEDAAALAQETRVELS
jgi:hypothetical protein